MEQTEICCPDDKNGFYTLLTEQLQALVDGEHHPMPILANASALLYGALKDINWAGFYLTIDDELLLGPFQGRVACTHIAVGRGVCGTAVLQNATQLVRDVHAFAGHIACDSASRSEIVVPLRHSGRVVGVLDIDSPLIGRFDDEDARRLEKLASIIESAADWAALL